MELPQERLTCRSRYRRSELLHSRNHSVCHWCRSVTTPFSEVFGKLTGQFPEHVPWICAINLDRLSHRNMLQPLEGNHFLSRMDTGYGAQMAHKLAQRRSRNSMDRCRLACSRTASKDHSFPLARTCSFKPTTR